MDLTEFQTKFKEIEDFIYNYISDTEKLKDKPDENKEPDYESITNIAKKYPLKRVVLKNASEIIKKEYISSLTYFLAIGENENFDRLLYICRILEGLELDISVEDICNSAIRFDKNDVEKACEELIEYKYSYLVDALIIANIKGEADKKILSLIADVARLMNCTKDDLRVIALVAKTALTDNADLLKDVVPPPGNIWSGKFNDFIPEEWFESQRYFCAKISYDKRSGTSIYNPTDESLYKGVIKTQVKSEDIVKKGDVILDFDVKSIKVKLENTIKAPCNGIVVAIDFTDKSDKDNKAVLKYTNIYVISCFDDYDKFITLIHIKSLFNNAIGLFANKTRSFYK